MTLLLVSFINDRLQDGIVIDHPAQVRRASVNKTTKYSLCALLGVAASGRSGFFSQQLWWDALVSDVVIVDGGLIPDGFEVFSGCSLIVSTSLSSELFFLFKSLWQLANFMLREFSFSLRKTEKLHSFNDFSLDLPKIRTRDLRVVGAKGFPIFFLPPFSIYKTNTPVKGLLPLRFLIIAT